LRRHKYKIPISALVLIYNKQNEVLLLHRADKENYWQSVTGSIEENELPIDAAKREVLEETGIRVEDYLFQDWKMSNQYEIFKHWRYRYEPGVEHNTEHIFALEVPKQIPIKLSLEEHIEYQWLDAEEAKKKVFSWTNVKAIENLCKIKLIAS